MANTWIPVSDKLPEEYESVLLSTDYGDVIFGFLTSSNQWLSEYVGYQYPEYKVLAWMPLPEPFATDTNVGNKKGEDDDI